ncbi:MAG: AAA family ATPase [Anaerolineales bacterium]
MTTTIALAGKGGTGKTTVAAMVIKYLTLNQEDAILAIDADPSANLHMVLGLELGWTVGGIREDLLKKIKESVAVGGAAVGSVAGGMSKHDYLNYEIYSALVESERFDLIAMGRSEGPGCYCGVNHNLRQIMDTLSENYKYVVVDNEAGMEHLSRRTTNDVEYLFVVSDPTQRGIIAAERIAKLKDELEIHIENTYLILNRLPGEIPPALQERIDDIGIPFLGVVPADDTLTTFEFSGKPIIELSLDSPVYQAVAEMMDKTLNL